MNDSHNQQRNYIILFKAKDLKRYLDFNLRGTETKMKWLIKSLNTIVFFLFCSQFCISSRVISTAFFNSSLRSSTMKIFEYFILLYKVVGSFCLKLKITEIDCTFQISQNELKQFSSPSPAFTRGYGRSNQSLYKVLIIIKICNN